MSNYVDPFEARLAAIGVEPPTGRPFRTVEQRLDAVLARCEALGAPFAGSAATLEARLDAALGHCEALAAEKSKPVMSAEETALRASHPGLSDELYAAVAARMKNPTAPSTATAKPPAPVAPKPHPWASVGTAASARVVAREPHPWLSAGGAAVLSDRKPHPWAAVVVSKPRADSGPRFIVRPEALAETAKPHPWASALKDR